MKFLSSLAGSVNSVADSVKSKQSSLRTSMTRSATGSSVPILAEAGGGAAESPQDGPGPTTSSILQRPLRLGSFDFDDGGTTFPDLYHEASTMLHLSNLIYVLAEIREMARNGTLGDSTVSSRVLDLPLRLDDAARIVPSVAPLLREKYDDGAHAALMGAIGSLLGRQEAVAREGAAPAAATAADAGKEDAATAAGVFGWIADWCGGSASADGGDGVGDSTTEPGGASMITAVGDSRINEELVYAVGVNHLEGRVTVIFRGSATRADFLADSRISLVRAPGPRAFHGDDDDDDDNPPDDDVGVHQGFHKYLMGEQKDGRPSKYAEIMAIVERTLAEAPPALASGRRRGGYRLYVTGHSLGGALATLFGFYASASPAINAPVTIVSVASPRVGNVEFARAFVWLESRGRVRHLRIANHRDPVTLGPTVSARRALALSAKVVSPLGYLALLVTGNGEGGDEEVYYHTGMKMKLLRNASPETNRRCELSYNGATILAGAKKLADADADTDADDLADMEQAKSSKKYRKSSSELPMVQYHYGDAYAERMASVEPDLKGLTLNDLYRSKARGML